MGAGHAGPMTQGILESRKVAHSLGFTVLHSSDNEGWPRRFTCRHTGCRTQHIERLPPPSNLSQQPQSHRKYTLESRPYLRFQGEVRGRV